jgi:hypothetical protein
MAIERRRFLTNSGVGCPDVALRNKLRPGDVVEAWDRTECVLASRARELFDEPTEAKEANDRMNQKRIAEQQDREQFERSWPARAFELAAKQNLLPNVQSFGPGR